MKKIIICLFLIFILSTNVFALENPKFLDIDNHWAIKEISILLRESIIQGYSDNTFRPNNYITVDEFLKIIVELADYKLITEGPRWPNWYIQTAVKNNLVENEIEDYSRYITRIEASRIIGNYINLKDVNKAKNVFKDLKEQEKDIVLKLAKLNVINGYTDKTFRSENFITRAEACKILFDAYNVKQELLKTRKGTLISKLTNIKELDYKNIRNQYEIKSHRLYFYDDGRYAKLNGQTLNQEYIKDKKIINILTELVGEDSYTELKYVPDKYIINSLNICYGKDKTSVMNGEYIFEVKFYEGSYYDVSKSKDEEMFMNDAVIKIKTGKMWTKKFESENEKLANSKNLYKLQEVIGIMLDESVKQEFIEYITAKRIEASKIPDSNQVKISEVKKIGKYKINTFCMNGNEIEIYIERF